MPDTPSEILKILAYFDLFDYPLTAGEIRHFLKEISEYEMAVALRYLSETAVVFRLGAYYSLRDNPRLVTARIEGNRRAKPLLDIAHSLSPRLYRFPFVRGICLSGSLSKNTAGEDGDIDYFIITAKGRLWIARTCMHLLKKFAYLSGNQHRYCMNYYIDEQALKIPEQNVYTAMEIVTLVPLCGIASVCRFFLSNTWTDAYFPNHALTALHSPHPEKTSGMKKILESMFKGRLGDRLENYLMHLTTHRWHNKERQGKRNVKGNRMGLDTGTHYCKPNPVYFQQALLSRYHARLQELRSHYPLQLADPLRSFFSKEKIT